MEEYPKCPICLDIYGINSSHIRAPKVLKCGDSFCKECLENIIKNFDKEYFSCPICKENVKKEQNIDDYTTNKEIIRMVNTSFNIPQKEVENEVNDMIINYDVLFLGDIGVGKTSIFQRLLQDKFLENNLSTVGFDFHAYYLKYKNKHYKLCIYDTAGQERYKTITKTILKKRDGLLLIYDVSDKKSFDDLEYWYNMYKEENEKVVGLLIGNKCDNKHEVNKEDALKFSEKYNLKYIETSARLDKNIKKAIALLLEEIIKSKPHMKNFIPIDNITLSAKKKKKKKWC